MSESSPRKLYRVAAVALALMLALAAAEFLARNLSPTYRRMHEPPHPFLAPDAARGWSLKPGYRGEGVWGLEFRVNQLGFRGPEMTRTKAPGSFRILVLGDSIVLGSGLPESALLTSRLEKKLASARPDLHFEAINGGVSGYDIEQERLLLEEQGPGLDLDAAVLVVCLNDVPGVTIADLVNPLRDLPVPGKSFLLGRSALALLIQGAYEGIGLKRENFLSRFLDADRHEPTRERIEAGWRAFQRELAAMTEFCRGRGMVFMVVVVPHAAQFQDERQRLIPQRRLATMTHELGIEDLDPEPKFASLPRLPYALPDPVHPSPAGHEVMAEDLAPGLLAKVPRPGSVPEVPGTLPPGGNQ